jgi:hypothetical protein
MNLSLDITPLSFSLAPQESLSYEDIASLERLRSTSFTFSDVFKDPTKMPSDTPTEFDVLLGREKESANHIGNKRYLAIVALHRNEYKSCTTRVAKTCITTRLIKEIHDCGGRFLKKNDETGEYEEVSHQKAHDKVSHALRQAKDPFAEKAPRRRRNIVRKPPTPQENEVFDFMFAEQQRIFQEMLAK